MEDTMAARYYCHACSRMVNPVIEVEIKCPFCRSGFVDEMGSGTGDSPDTDSDFSSDRDLFPWVDTGSDFGSDRDLFLWVLIILYMMGNRGLFLWVLIIPGMIGNPRRGRRVRRIEFDDGEAPHGRDTDREFESTLRRTRMRSSATNLPLPNGIGAGITSESENSGTNLPLPNGFVGEIASEPENSASNLPLPNGFVREIASEPENSATNLLLPNGFVPEIASEPENSENDRDGNSSMDPLNQTVIGQGYGPPAQREAIEALPTVTIEENIQCAVCLNDFEIGTEAKEMPCRDKFHCECLLPWLEDHSCCPVCRYQLPADELRPDSERSRISNNQRESENNAHGSGEESEGNRRNGNA